MDERKFIEKLQARAQEQEQLVRTVPFPGFFGFVARWFSYHPWRFLIPLSFIISILLRLVFGPGYTTFILAIIRWL